MKNQTTLKHLLADWDSRDHTIMAVLCDIDDDLAKAEVIAEQIRWMYHSRTRHSIKRSVKRVTRQDASNEMPCPSYEALLAAAAKKLGIHKHCTLVDEYERYIPQAVIVAALTKMNPMQRDRFFSEEFNAAPMWEAAGIKSREITGIRTAASVLAIANASGYAVYAGATTALGFATHAVGITLPYAAYTGLSATIAQLIGPPGWLALATYGFFKVTGTDWNKLMPVLLTIIATKSRYEILAHHQPQ
ncbi:Uncharacterised protein [Zhongshania aliphaticivorans]|uniref:DUF3944 domain-containing protein n=1 Tax=Zhongshania aliphaticivorans TaxID=1470434 RepID=A0A5S9MUG4_9GAMM|nr:hypothetical protein [Zhongshania aliphaticivorans]CAA0080610.1 Uncharacterised protein [Zhongshania aliphaticivorans]CAA0085632.1 Uncharacterised protein [Zhongshania aliphaticivorans]